MLEMAAAMPGVRTTRSTPRPSADAPAATGGRFGPWRTTSSPGEQHPHCPAVKVGQPPGRPRPPRTATLPPNAPPLASGDGRLSPGQAPRCVGLQIGRFHPGGAQASPPSRPPEPPTEAGTRQWCGGPAPLPAAARASVSVSATTPPPVRRPYGDERVGRSEVVGEAALAEGDAGTDPLGRAAFDGGAQRRRVEVALGQRCTCAVCVPARRGSSASRCSGTDARQAPARPPDDRTGAASEDRPCSPASRTMIPGVQNPHWLAPVAQNASAQRRSFGRVEAVERRDRATCDSAYRRHAGDTRRAVDQHGAAAALALGTAAVLR